MTTHLPRQPRTKNQELPPLESGDRLSRPEFERRYATAPHIKKAELIEGIVYVAFPKTLSATPYSLALIACLTIRRSFRFCFNILTRIFILKIPFKNF
jgi:hypothetical protein